MSCSPLQRLITRMQDHRHRNDKRLVCCHGLHIGLLVLELSRELRPKGLVHLSRGLTEKKQQMLDVVLTEAALNVEPC
jgi:hypothetical protein